MVTVAIISEYNPFHTGHKYQIEKIRHEFGSDTRIIAIMSGNYTQRGDIASIDKSIRAQCAILSGVNLVLEIPFPFSISSAEIFAKSGVHIANAVSVIDYLSFGSESGDIQELLYIAKNMLSSNYENELSKLIKKESSIGYAALTEYAYNNIIAPKLNKAFFTSNNILAIEYIKELIRQNSKIQPHTIRRHGSDYNDKTIRQSEHQSATAIRTLLKKNIDSAVKYMPNISKNVIVEAYKSKQLPCDGEKLSPAIISHFRLNSSTDIIPANVSDEGLYNRLKNNSFKADTISKLIELTATKKYTYARIKRALWYSYFGVTSSEIKELPNYTQVLAMDSVGKSILKEIKKISSFPVMTKPSAISQLTDKAKKQKQRADSADSVFQLTKPNFVPGDASLTTTPFILN